jgi:hypothetical protein
MKAYLIVTGTVFLLVTIAHLMRSGELMSKAATDPWYVVMVTALTVLSLSLTVWAGRLLRKLPSA